MDAQQIEKYRAAVAQARLAVTAAEQAVNSHAATHGRLHMSRDAMYAQAMGASADWAERKLTELADAAAACRPVAPVAETPKAAAQRLQSLTGSRRQPVL